MADRQRWQQCSTKAAATKANDGSQDRLAEGSGQAPRHGRGAADIPVIVCGMAGAKQGWVGAGYVDVPTSLSAILTGAVPVPARAATSASCRVSPSATGHRPT